MKKGLRFIVALFAAKWFARTVRLFGHGGSHTPARIAKRIDPAFFEKIERPAKVVCITGTNGKTTVNNIVSQVLTKLGIGHARNLFGSNLHAGAVSALIEMLDWRGRMTVDLAVLEVDEISTKTVFPYLKPDIVAVTVIFRDSYARNAHTDFISELLNDAIPEESLLILNSDDLISSSLAPDNQRRFFSVDRLPGEEPETTALINDLSLCPTCRVPIDYTFQRYHHIGRATCPSCGMTNAGADYVTTKLENEHLIEIQEVSTASVHGYKQIGANITDIYNETLAIVLLREMGFQPETIADAITDVKVKSSRFDEETFGDKRMISIMGKDQNPVATTRAFAVIGGLKDAGRVCVLIVNESIDLPFCPENLAYVYDVNVEYLDRPFIKTIGVASQRRHDYVQRLLLGHIAPEKIISATSEKELANMINVDDYDTIVLVTGTSNAPGIKEAQTILRTQLAASR